MAESADYTPAHWSGHDFSDARKHYDVHVGRSYTEAISEEKTISSLLESRLYTTCKSPLIICSDVTGSMGEWPAVMFSKLPYLELEGQEYMGKDFEIAWMAVGDCFGDRYPLQARPFTKGTDLKSKLEQIVIEKGGGPGASESYQVAGFYALHQVNTPNAERPLFIMIGDEAPYNVVSLKEAQLMGVSLTVPVSTTEVFRLLKERMAVYLIRKPYNSDLERSIHQQWVNLLGEDHVVLLSDPQRVVDLIFGIMAKEKGKTEYFKKEIEGRQTKEQVSTVYKALKTVHKMVPDASSPAVPLAAAQSTLHRPGSGKKSGDLL